MSNRPTKILYTAEATADGGRAGRVRSTDGAVDLKLAPPVEMGGDGAGSNPEQLFAAGYGACFHSALGVVARRARVDVEGSTVTAKVGIGPTGSGGYGLAVELLVALPGVAPEAARELVEQAHQVCPYSNATRGNIDVTLTLV
ncbi:organic hydroperoxide resistance protein [Actinocatenispora rupis]|uniref:Organic hydroperoxide resistance protein n=1 Tax=Actinocatenispora rupis TaxID=519421 RepID=A0A8J3J6I2_9ACTN|nr:organic hydroperoxide resistance protein [Actinocatenispora rupis]GID15735.1 organic hydroperoxide resistance protein [Actinocatenispora rupis]